MPSKSAQTASPTKNAATGAKVRAEIRARHISDQHMIAAGCGKRHRVAGDYLRVAQAQCGGTVHHELRAGGRRAQAQEDAHLAGFLRGVHALQSQLSHAGQTAAGPDETVFKFRIRHGLMRKTRPWFANTGDTLMFTAGWHDKTVSYLILPAITCQDQGGLIPCAPHFRFPGPGAGTGRESRPAKTTPATSDHVATICKGR